MVESTALEMRHTGNRIGGSNPSLSASPASRERSIINRHCAPCARRDHTAASCVIAAVRGLSLGYSMQASGHGPAREYGQTRALRLRPVNLIAISLVLTAATATAAAAATDGAAALPSEAYFHRRTRSPAPGRPADGRGRKAPRPAAGDGPARRRHYARPVAVRPGLAVGAARAVSRRRRAEEHARCRLSARHPDAAVADRHGDRPAAGAPRRPRRRDRRHRRRHAAFRLRLCARRIPAGRSICRTGSPARHGDLSRHGAVDLVGEDRRHGGARNEFHAPRSRPDHRRLGDPRGHHRLGHHRRGVRTGVRGHRRPVVGRPRLGRHGVVHGCQPYGRPPHRVHPDPLGQRQFRQRLSRSSPPSCSS